MSQYAQDMNLILAALQEEGGEQTEQQLPDEEHVPDETPFAYPINLGGVEGVVLTKEPVPPEFITNTTVIENGQEPDKTPTKQAAQKEPPFFLVVLLLFCLFALLDIADNTFIALMTPTVNITLVPQVKTITLQSSATLGNVLSPITVSQSLSVSATGHGHQDAKRATGSVTFYNGLFTAQVVAQGTVFTGSDGVRIVTTAPATIPPGNPGTGYGTTTIPAQAVQTGTNGNIAPGDITITINNGLLVRNNQFANGQDARDFPVVTQADLQNTTAALQAKVTSSMTAALQGQLLPGQALQPTPCNPTVSANHAVGDEAATVNVTVSQTCSAIAYNSQELTIQAMHTLANQVARTLGKGYTRSGNITVAVTKASIQQHTVVLTFTCQGTWMYHIDEARMQALVSGKPRLDALCLLLQQPGIQRASITGISDNQLLPDDQTHLHLLIVVTPF